MARKPTGKVKLRAADGSFVWVDGSAIHTNADELDELEPPSPPAQGDTPSPAPSGSGSSSSSEPIATPRASIAPSAPDAPRDDLDEFYGLTERRVQSTATASAPSGPPRESTAPSAPRDELEDFWNGDEPRVLELEQREP